MYVELPEHINCSFAGGNTPVILRFEAATESGGMTVEEYDNARPFITLYGDVADARVQFLAGIHGLADYLILLERHSTIQSDGCWAEQRWFQMEIRRRGAYRAVLYGEGDAYRFSYMLATEDLDTQPLIDGMRLAYDRLKATYEMFFATTI